MASFTKTILSGSTDGRGIKVGATSTPGTLIHTGSTTVADLHEVWLYAFNHTGVSAKLTIEWGGVTSPDDLIEETIAGEAGLKLLVPGGIIKGNASALEIRAFADTTNVIMIHGYVNTIT